ncbi:MAG TPA: CapA family protein, partial [Anaerolineales bacterium]|nr:CapA family protein [Anaerolineales bacterium]
LACGGPVQQINPPSIFITYTAAPLATPTNFSPPIQIQTAAPIAIGKQIGAAVPNALRAQAEAWNIPADAALTLDLSVIQSAVPLPNLIPIQWVYVLAAPFPTVQDGVTSDEVRALWSGGRHALLMDESTLAAFTALWGAPVTGFVRSVPADQLLDSAWADAAWAIIPFENLSPRWKVLTIDGQSPIQKGFDPSRYPLIVSFTLQSSTPLQPSDFNLDSANYDSAKLTTVVITGTTALVRATAFKMEQKGITYPGEEVRDILREADIAHMSNEVSFFTGCPAPDPNSGRLIFCSDPKYIDLLTDIGVDVVELTGNHFSDYGNYAMAETLSIYGTHNIAHFGGGSDLQDALKPALFDVHGNRIAFLGCNVPDVGKPDIATADHPGSAPCDFDYFAAKVGELKAQGYLVIFAFQWGEDYVPQPDATQVEGFRRMVDAGATVVSGSQAHFPKTMEFYHDSFIHYGLGNLFFDQMGNFDWMPDGIRREFLDRYVLYGGKLISVELFTTLLEDFARPRLMTPDERSAFLQEYFADSGWAVTNAAGTSGP